MDTVFTTTDGIRLRARVDLPVGESQATIVLVHGIGDQVDGLPYTTAAAAFTARGFAVHRLELRGHGRSGGTPAFVESFDVYRADLHGFVQATIAASPATARTFLVGVSMGGLIVTDYAIHHAEGLSGIVAVAPALGETGGSRVLLALLPLLARVVPRLRLDPEAGPGQADARPRGAEGVRRRRPALPAAHHAAPGGRTASPPSARLGSAPARCASPCSCFTARPTP